MDVLEQKLEPNSYKVHLINEELCRLHKEIWSEEGFNHEKFRVYEQAVEDAKREGIYFSTHDEMVSLYLKTQTFSLIHKD